MKKLTKMIFIIFIANLFIFGNNYSYATEEQTSNQGEMSIAYNSHVQDYGWEPDFSKINGQESGTTGRNKKNEAIKIKLLNAPEGVGVTYQSYLNGIGWQEWKKNGEESGTTGQNRIMEAIKIQLTGTKEYSVEYRTHLEEYGWQEWKKDGEISGAIGHKRKIEAIEIRIVSKEPQVIYQTHLEERGWQPYYKNGETSGIISEARKVEAIRIELKGFSEDISIKYQSHVQDYGWEKDWKVDGQDSGTTGQNKKIEAIRIKLNEKYVDDKYTVLYRAYVQGQGWQEWKKDGEIAGTTGKNLRLEAIEIKIEEQQGNEFEVKYLTHLQDYGWQDYEKQGSTSGRIGEDKKIEAIKIVGKNIPEGVKIKYLSHVQDYGWENQWKTAGEQSGTTGQNKKVEAVKIKLEGTDEYSIAYRVYVQGKGWQGWANDGEESGTTGKNLKLEAIEIKIVPKISNRITWGFDTQVPQKMGQENLKISAWLMTDISNTSIKVNVEGEKLPISIIRTKRADILESVKGYGGEEKNPTPGIEININFSNATLGDKKIKIQCIDGNGNVLAQNELNTRIYKSIKYEEGTYGVSGLKAAGKGGSDLKYLKYGYGENVFFATFAIHGYEDNWDKDGKELVDIANQFYQKLLNDKDYDLAEKWTIYIFPGVNQDGLNSGWTKNGPGRTTVYSQAPGNKGIDLNRCWQDANNYVKYTTDRNYNGTTAFQAYEAQALRDFFLNNKSQNGQTVLVDLHGWTQQLIGDEEICSYYEKQFSENNKNSVGRYGTGYMIGWARTNLGSTTKTAKAALIELPKNVTSHQSVVNQNLANRYITATLDMLNSMNTGTLRMARSFSLFSNNRTTSVEQSDKYEVAFTGMYANENFDFDDVDNFVEENNPTKMGIWVKEQDKEKFLKLIESETESIYDIDEEDYLYIKNKDKQNENDKKIEEKINGNKLYMFSVSSTCYIIDEVTGEILDYCFEDMDQYQTYEYFESDDRCLIFITENKNEILSNNEILTSILNLITT